MVSKVIEIPKGYELSSIKDGKIYLVSDSKLETWEDCAKNFGNKGLNYINSHCEIITTNNSTDLVEHNANASKNLHPSEYSEALIALMQLCVCYKAWVYKFDREYPNEKRNIRIAKNSKNYPCYVFCKDGIRGFLMFDSLTVAERFIDTFKDLLIKAAPLL